VVTGGDEWEPVGDFGVGFWLVLAAGALGMLLTGSYRRSLDDKLRFAIPKQLREQVGFPLQTSLFIGPGTDKSLVVYPLETMEKLGLAMDKLNPAARDARTFTRLFYSQAQPADVDRQGRLRVPNELATLAEITSEVVVLGVRDHIELWQPAQWDQFLASNRTVYDELAEAVLERCSASTATPVNMP